MIPLWAGPEFAGALGCDDCSDFLVGNITGISIDSRTLCQGDAFFAIRGETFDGHDFAPEAARKGASVLVITKAYEDFLKNVGVPLVVVDDVTGALVRLAAVARSRCQAKVIAVTGSVGKTTVKEAMRHVFADIGKVHASPASFNNHWGVPLTLARMPADTHFGIFEIGMNHENEIRPLVKLVKPDLSVITRIAEAHIGYFIDIEAIADAKAEIFEGVQTGGAALLNADDALFPYLVKKARASGVSRIISFGAADVADYRLLDVELRDHCAWFKAVSGHEEVMVRIGSPGIHMVQNALAVLAGAGILGIDMAHSARALQGFSAGSGRGARYRLALPSGRTFLLVDESYNANPASMRAALSVLGTARTEQYGRRIAVLGDMLELGHFARKAHEELACPIGQAGINLAFLAGHNMRYLADVLRKDLQVYHCDIASDLFPLVANIVRAGDIVMVKASNNVGLSHIVAKFLGNFRHVSCER